MYQWTSNDALPQTVLTYQTFTPTDQSQQPTFVISSFTAGAKASSPWKEASPSGELAINQNYSPGDYSVASSTIKVINEGDPTIRNHANGNDMPISFLQGSNDTNPHCVAWIAGNDPSNNGGPSMPMLSALGGAPVGLTMEWKLKVVFHDRHGNPHRDFDTGDSNDRNASASIALQDSVQIPSATSGSRGSGDLSNDGGWRKVIGGGIEDGGWVIYGDQDWIAQINSAGFFGGDAVLSLRIIDANGSTLFNQRDFLFRIAGENPTQASCQNYINQMYNGPTPNWVGGDSTQFVGYWFADAIAREETKGDGGRRYYSQFLDNGGQTRPVPGKEGKPDWNNDGAVSGSGGYGLFQLTFSRTEASYIMQRDWIWNWQSDVQQFLPIVESKKALTVDYLNYVAGHNASYFDPSTLTTIASKTAFNFWESSVIKIYNTASQIVDGHIGAWAFTPTSRGTAARWEYVPNRGRYLFNVAFKGIESP
jgi:hypothetical protein